MNFLINLLVLCLALPSQIMGDLRYLGNAVHKDYPNQCYYKELDQLIPISRSFRPRDKEGYCQSIYCRSDYVLEIEICGRHNLQPNATCSIKSDISKRYPSCCPQLICE